MKLTGWLTLGAVAGSLATGHSATTNVAAGGAFPNFFYNPKVVSIQAGDTVIWTGLGSIHSVTSNDQPGTLCGATPVPGGSCTNTFSTPGTYLYHCINHVSFGMTGAVIVAAAAQPPAVAVTNPVGGAVFAEPARIKLAASAGAAVTNVQFFGNGASLGAVSSAPFGLTTAPLPAGTYALTAAARASTGLSATSAPVNITVVTPVAVSNYAPRVVAGQFVFDHTANPGLSYVVESSATQTNWSPVTTNTATSNSVEVLDVFQVGNLRFYRVGRLPNP
jgi:plastocyanin